jgi:hypothetical protein
MFQFSLSKYILVLVLAVCIFLSSMVASEGGYITDYTAFGPIPIPETSEWRYVLDSKKSEIETGSTDIEFLNSCFVGGWRRCFENFAGGSQPWNYEEILANEPWLLGGNMTDTDRVAGNEGWKRASEVIGIQLQTVSYESARNRVRYTNRKVYAIAALVFLIFVWLVLDTRAVNSWFAGRKRDQL